MIATMEHFHSHPLLPLGILLIAGYLGGRVAHHFRLPRVTGYLVAGIALSPSFTPILQRAQVEVLLDFVASLALAVIAFAIGGSLIVSRLKVLGKAILCITVTQALGAMFFASLAVYLVSSFFPLLKGLGSESFLSLLLIVGAVSAATAPAAILAVVHESRARGPLTTTLLGVVALDDALTIILFSVALSISGYFLELGTANTVLVNGLMEIIGALFIGAVAGIGLSFMINVKQRVEVNLVLLLGAVLLVSGVALQFGFSSLLANMTMGFFFVNRLKEANDLFRQLETIEEPLYCLFFALAGAHFDTGIITSAAILGVTLMVGRFIGKLTGTMIGARLSQAPAVITKYLGMALLPKAGLSLGLILLTRSFFQPEIYELLLNGMLASIILNELVAPPILKWVFIKAGEIGDGERHENQ